jgi:hypothetical protein
VRSGPQGSERDLEAALVALIEVALRGVERDGGPQGVSSEDQVKALARALAGAVREVIRAPLREALQAGYELGLRAAREAQTAQSAAPGPAGWGGSAAASTPPTRPAPDAAAPAAVSSVVDGLLPAEPSTGAGAREALGVIMVEVSPFTSFTAVNRFHAAVTAAPGVSRAAIVAFRGGKLRLRVHHPDVRALAATLQSLDLGPLRVLRMAPDALELLLGSSSAPLTLPPLPGGLSPSADS